MRILFVCLGNICRSPAAEAVFRRISDLPADSAGTGDWHIGKPPHAPMQEAAAARGYEMADLRARQFTAADFERFGLIVAMDRDNLADIEALRPAGNETPVVLLGSEAPGLPVDVPDPYLTGGYDESLEIIEAGVQALAERLSG